MFDTNLNYDHSISSLKTASLESYVKKKDVHSYNVFSYITISYRNRQV